MNEVQTALTQLPDGHAKVWRIIMMGGIILLAMDVGGALRNGVSIDHAREMLSDAGLILIAMGHLDLTRRRVWITLFVVAVAVSAIMRFWT